MVSPMALGCSCGILVRRISGNELMERCLGMGTTISRWKGIITVASRITLQMALGYSTFPKACCIKEGS